MYNPCRGGVRGGADQFTWESVKTDKYRENYLGHSLKAPVGRWQKGKDLSWYARERNDETAAKTERSQMAAIKRAEQEAMMVALGHNVIRKESQSLTKEEMTEALRRNIGDRDDLNIERVDGVGAKSRRAALYNAASCDARTKKEGVAFETSRQVGGEKAQSSAERSSNKKKLKKSDKKKTKRRHDSSSSDSEEDTSLKVKDGPIRDRTSSLCMKKKKRRHDSSESEGSSEVDNSKKKKHKKHSKAKHSHKSAKRKKHNLSGGDHEMKKRHKERTLKTLPIKRRRHDTSESE